MAPIRTPHNASGNVRRQPDPAKRLPGATRSPRRLGLVSSVQDAQRKRRPQRGLRRLVAIVPVSDYRDVAG
jgi:hypothetical protein